MLGVCRYLLSTILKRKYPGEEGETVSVRHWHHGPLFCPLQGLSGKDVLSCSHMNIKTNVLFGRYESFNADCLNIWKQQYHIP